MLPSHLHFALFITFLTLFLKLLGLGERDTKASAIGGISFFFKPLTTFLTSDKGI
jgi:hypothetical protein